ncbi:hypothetical protein TRFO_24262 [Tritrichomonas foetus]|uniref:Uncharacterized protein n=1 Tax=Tritrichomonas foetus TaxID=1144522 RepID=A0A1J4KCT2_9EUKA|nr:hypothetical protein TRFO_24262 [Tritrichomonas foetus]|eukprot:OHT07454.1 hypothetical protein TRFO_24262 [Tritrichomonas foetus]
MQELSQIINNSINAPLDLIHWLQEHHVEIVLGKIGRMQDFVRDVFALFSQRPNNYDLEEWERLTMIAYIFIISAFPPPNLIPKISLTKAYGPLFSTSLLLNSWRPPDVDTKEQYIDIFHVAVNYFNTGFQTPHFYSRSPIYFYHLIPTLLEKEIPTHEFYPQIQFFINSIQNVQKSDLNFDFVLFASEVLKGLKGCPTVPQELMAALGKIFELSSASSCIFLQHFFYIWYYFVNRYSDRNNNPQGIEMFYDQIDTVTKLFSITASLKHHELHRTFHWYLCFYFFDFVKKEEYQERILSLICNGIRRVNRIDSVSRMPDMVNRFSSRCIANYKNENSWAMHYLLASLDSTILGLITDLKRIIGAASMNSTQNEPIAMQKVFFADENSGLSQLDFELYAIYPERYFKTPEEVVPVFNLMTKYCDSIRKHLSSAALFQLTFAINIREMLKKDLSMEINKGHSVPLHYFTSITRSWTQLMIIVSHRQNVMNTYAQREILSYPNFTRDLSSKIKNPRRLLDFTAVFRRFFNIIEECPHEFYPILAVEIATQMFNAMKKGLLTYTFIEYFLVLPLVLDENYNKSIFSNILSRMMEIAANNTHLFFSQSAADTTLLYQWIIFTIRFGAAPTNNKPNPLLGLFLNLYQRLFITAVLFNIKRIANQSIALRTVTLYLQQLKFHYHTSKSNSEIEPKKKGKGRTKPILIEEIQESAKFEAFDTLLTFFIEEPKFMELQYLMPFLDVTFQLGDRQLISKASSICLKKFKIEKANKYIQNMDPSSTLFNSFFSIINKVGRETGKEILKIIPAYAPLYLQVPQKPIYAYQGITIDEYGFDIDSILEAVTNHLSDNEEIIAGLFSLISCCFSIVLKNLHRPPSSYTKAMKQLLVLLCHCWCYNHLHPQIEKYAFHLAGEFGKAFVKGDSNVFIICLLDVAGCSRSAMAKISLDIAKTFFEFINGQQIDSFFIEQTVENILSFFPPATRLFSMLCGFSLMNRFFPNYIRIDHVRAFLVQTTDISPLDMKFPRNVNRFLKEYLSSKPESEKVLFVHMVYDIICPLSMGIRDVLMKRVEKLGIPMPISSLNELDNCPTPFLYIQRITLILLCGTQNGNFEITNPLFQKLVEFLAPRSDVSCSFEKLSRLLSLILAILKNDNAFNYFSQNNELSSFLHYLCNALSLKVAPLNKSAKKCFKILKDKEIKDSRFERHLEDFYVFPEKIFKFYSSPPERINFYVRLAKILPLKIPPMVINSFFNALFDFEGKRDSEKMQNLPHLIKILKFFTIKEYIHRNEISSTILSKYNDNLTYLQNYITVVVHLYDHNEIPFITVARKYIVRFLAMFANETIDYLMNTERSMFTFHFLQDLIIKDETLIFFKTFLWSFEKISDYSTIHPSIFKLVEDISLEKRLARDPLLLQALFTNFDNLYMIVSTIKSRNENDFTLISYVATAILNVFKCQICVKNVISFCRIFTLSHFARSNVSKLYLVIVFKKSSQQFLDELLEYVVTNATTLEPIYVQSLLPHLIRNINKTDLSFLWNLLPRWTTDCFESRYAFLHSILRLLGKCNPTKEALEIILEVIKATISSADIRLLIYSLKTATCLSKKKLLPPKVYYSIFRQLFTYPKFSEPPYSKYFFAFLKSDPDRLTQIPPQDCTILSYYMHNRFLHLRDLKNVLSPINSVFIAAPQLYSYLPFSLVISVATLLKLRLTNPNRDDEPNEVNDAFSYAASFCLIMKPTQEELDFFIGVCFSYLEKLLAEKQKTEFYELFYNLLTTNITKNFPKSMLKNITEIDNNTFGLVCCAAHNIPHVLFNEYYGLVEMTLKFVEYERNIVNIPYLQCFMTNLIKTTGIDEKFKEPLNHAFIAVKNWYTANNGDRLFVISKAIILYKASECLDHLWSFYDQLQGRGVDRRPLLRFLINCIENVPHEKQIITVQMIFSKVRHSAKKTHVFTTSLPLIFQSTTVINSVKEYIIENLIPLLLIDKLCNAEKMLAMLCEYSKQSAFNCNTYIIQLLLIRAHRANNSGCLIFIERVIEMLPSDFKSRIAYLIQTLPIEMWEDSFIPVIISLLTPKIPIWQPLFTLAHKFGSIGGELVAVTFAKLLDESNVNIFQHFLAKLLKSNLKVKHTQIISGVLTMFHNKQIKIAYHLAEKAIKYSGNIHQFEFFLEPETSYIPAARYLLPHDANDIIFSTYRPYLTKSQASAVALTFVNEYEAANATYMQDGPLFFKEMQNVNNHFIIGNENNIHSLLKHLTTIGRVNAALKYLEVAANSYQRNLDTDALEKVTESNYSTTIGKKFFSPFEKQRLCIIQAMVSLIAGEPQLNSDTSCMSHAFLELYEKFKDFLNNTKSKNDIEIDKNDTSAVVLLMPSMKDRFNKVVGFTPPGLVAIGKSHIEAYFTQISKKLESNEMQRNDYREFAAFSFVVFCAQPSPQLNSTAFGAYCKIFCDTLDYPQYVVHEAAARIITMCRLAIHSNDEAFLATVRSSKAIFNQVNSEKWRFWLAHLVELANTPWFCDMVFDMLKEMPYRSLLYSKRGKSLSLSDALLKVIHEKPSSQISMMKICENFFNSLFEIDFQEKETQSRIVRFAVELGKLDIKTIINLDIMSERQKIPNNPFQRSLQKLTLNQINLLGDIQSFAYEVKNRTYEQIIEFVQSITNSKHSLTEIQSKIGHSVHAVNENLPFIFPLRLEKPLQISINQISEDFTALTKDIIVIKMISNIHQWQHYIIQRSTNTNGYNKSVITLANTMFLIKLMLQRQYSARRRNLLIFPSQFFEIGENLILIPVISEPQTMELLFQESEMMTSAEWISKYAVPSNDFNDFNTFNDSNENNKDEKLMKFVLNEEGIEQINRLSTHYFIKKYSNEISADIMMRMRPILANSMIVSGLFRQIFNAKYPTLQTCVFCPQTAVVPLMHSDYDYNKITDTDSQVASSFRLSPNMVNVHGPALKGRCVVTMAVMSKALTENIESMRSYIEALIGDEDFTAGRVREISEMIETRSKIEKRFLDFCPPTGSGVGPEIAEEWIEKIETFLDIAMNPDLHPVEAIPWY